MANLTSFHALDDSSVASLRRDGDTEPSPAYDFSLHQHSYAGELMRRLLETSVSGLEAADTDTDRARSMTLRSSRCTSPTAVVARSSGQGLDFTRRRVRRLQLGALLPRAAHGRDPPEQERALRGRAALVPLRLRPDRRQRRAHARALLEGAAVPDHRRRDDRGHPGQPRRRARTAAQAETTEDSIDAWKAGTVPPAPRRPLPAVGATCSRR